MANQRPGHTLITDRLEAGNPKQSIQVMPGMVPDQGRTETLAETG
jgi:hypothetical protein